MNEDNAKILKEKILTGMKLAFNRLLELKKLENSEFIFSQEGKIVKIKARDVNHQN